MKFFGFAATLIVAGTLLATPPVPRKAAEFTIVDAAGKSTLLSSYKGKVVMLEFISTTCPHCQRLSQEVSKLNQELGPRGFQPVGVAFNQEANPATVTEFIKNFGVNFPIGYSKPETVLGYLGVSVMERWVYPEVVIIDRKGVVRAQSPAQGDPKLQDPAQLRTLLDGLLKEK